MRRLFLLFFCACVAPYVIGGGGSERPPNFLVVVADDLGYSDLGSFGGEIETPNLDRLANQGLRLTNFHTAATCSPTRSMLLSGVDHHRAGLGSMAEALTPNQKGKPGYEGYLNHRVVSLATRLRDGGYQTFMAGKWHLGMDKEQSPAARGFDQSFTLLQGGGNHFDDVGMFPVSPVAFYREGYERTEFPKGTYSSELYADKLIGYLQQGSKDQPFFAYLAFTAPHWPLQAPQSAIEKYRGRYSEGYDVLRNQRIKALGAKGLIEGEPAQRLDNLPYYRPWQELSAEEQAYQARTMEVYAAMVDEMDRQFGRVLDYLKESGELENTVIVFLSDNGAEGTEMVKRYAFFGLEDWLKEKFDNRFENIGKPNSYVWQGPGWASAVMAPYYQTKGTSAEGGIRTPAFIWNPNFKRQSANDNALVTVKDIAPTLLEMAGVEYAGDSYAGKTVEQITGRSMLPWLQGESEGVYSDAEPLAWELFGNRAVRRGDWKLVSLTRQYGGGGWRLYNLADDPAESVNLAEQYPDKVAQMLGDWDRYAEENRVVLPEFPKPH